MAVKTGASSATERAIALQLQIDAPVRARSKPDRAKIIAHDPNIEKMPTPQGRSPFRHVTARDRALMRNLGRATVAANNTSRPPAGLSEALERLWKIEQTRGVPIHTPRQGNKMHSTDNPWTASLRSVCAILDEHRTSYAIAGAHAANLYRNQTRATFDIDLLVSMPSESIRAISTAAARRGWHIKYLDPEGALLRMSHEDLGPVDLIAVQMDYQEIALQRALVHELAEGISVPVLAIEDVLIHKLIAGRHRDLDDITSILETSPELDLPYIEHWADKWKLGDFFQKLRKDVEQSLRQLPRNAADDYGPSR